MQWTLQDKLAKQLDDLENVLAPYAAGTLPRADAVKELVRQGRGQGDANTILDEMVPRRRVGPRS
jgi:hypothetical protein